MNTPQPLGFVRRNFFPIYNHELKKFLPLSLIFFFISFNYAILRVLKDTFVISSGGSEAIAATKLWGVLPMMLVFKFVYDDISQRTGRIGRFNIVVAYFLVYFGVFAFWIHPNAEMLEAHGVADACQRVLPFLKDTWNIIRFWPITLYYIHAEAWGTFALSILFYTFTNEITNTKQSGRFYPFLSIAANIGTLLAGEFSRGTFVGRPSVQMALLPVLVNGCILMVVYTLFSRSVSRDPAKYEVEQKAPKKKKMKLSIVQALQVLFKSRYLLLIGFIVTVYALCINLFEAIYKDYLKSMAKAAASGTIAGHLEKTGVLLTKKEAIAVYVQEYMGLQLSLIGVFAILFSLFLATPAMRLGWRFVGSVTPGIVLVNTGLFLGLLFFKDRFGFMARWFNTDVGMFTLIVGLMNVVFIKGSKYTFFDPFKENKYIPLDPQSKLLGKSSIENLSRWGKAAGSFLITFIIAPLGGVVNFRGLLGLIILGIVCVWLWAVQDLTNRFYALTKGANKGKGGASTKGEVGDEGKGDAAAKKTVKKVSKPKGEEAGAPKA